MDDLSVMAGNALPDLESSVEDGGNRDLALVAAALRDRAAFALLYERYADQLYWYALGRTGSETVADDVVSETMIAALEGLHRFDPGRGSLAPWLFTIASRRIADRERSHGRFWRAAMRWWRPSEMVEDTASTVERDEDARRVRQALSTLSTEDRELVLLRYSAELNSRQIAEILGLSSGAVRMRLNRLRERLASELGTDQ